MWIIVFDERRFSDEELDRLLRRAVEMETGSDRIPSSLVPAGAREGFTLREIEGIAREAGIDPRLVRAAAREEAPGGGLARWAGAAIRQQAAHHGVVVLEPGTHVWRTVGQPTQLDVALATGPRSTRVTLTADRSGAAALTVFGSFAAWSVAAGITGAVVDPESAMAGAAILGAAMAGGVLTARALWSRGTRRLEGLIMRLGPAILKAATPTSTPPTRSGSPDPTA